MELEKGATVQGRDSYFSRGKYSTAEDREENELQTKRKSESRGRVVSGTGFQNGYYYVDGKNVDVLIGIALCIQ